MVNIAEVFPFAPFGETSHKSRKVTAVERFVDKIDFGDECWTWTAALQTEGYGVFIHRHVQCYAHRISYEWANGKIDKELTIDHLCRNRRCVNPSHLEEVSIKENTLRGTGITAVNARKTHCTKGHELTEDNTYTKDNSKGEPRRRCRKCENDKSREAQRKRRREYLVSLYLL